MAIRIFIGLSFSVLLICSCSIHNIVKEKGKTQTYQRTFDGNAEKIKIDFDRLLFTYFTEIDGQNYLANGSLKVKDTLIEFKFPAYSEYDGLPFFPKEHWNLNLIDTCEHFEIEISIIDIETKEEVRNKHVFYFHPMKSTSVYKSADQKNVIIKTPASKIDLTFYRPHKGKDIIKIPKKGKYQLVFNMLSPKTDVLYETTNKGCFMSTFDPIVTMNICNESEKEIESFDFIFDCSNAFILESVINELE